jgi:hypothetical protein
MALGAGYGAGLARPQALIPSRGFWTVFRRSIAGLLAVALVGLAVLIPSPGQTPPILDSAGRPIPGSINELTKVSLGGHDQWLEIRGRSVDKPVLLYLSGGPGQSDLAFSPGAVRRPGERIRRRRLGPARHRQVLPRARPGDPDARPGRVGHDRAHRLPTPPVRGTEDLPHGRVFREHPRRPRRPTAPRAVLRADRLRADGRRPGDRPAPLPGRPRVRKTDRPAGHRPRDDILRGRRRAPA